MSAVYRPRQGAPRAPSAASSGPSRVERRGKTRILRIAGTHASMYRPGEVLAGPVWDAIASGLCALPEAQRRSVLLLGLGGGSAARVVRALAPRARIVGVEIDPEVVRLARREFDLDALDLEVVVADALRFVRETRRRFDAVLEDIFVGKGRGAHKPAGLPEPGLGHAAACLKPGGVLVSNALDEAPAVARVLGALFTNRVRIDVADYDNRVFVARNGALEAATLRRAIADSGVLAPRLADLRLRSLPSR